MTEPALLRMAAGLALVVVAILALAWCARRAGLVRHTPARLLRRVDHLSLGPRSGLTVVAVGNTWLVLGVTAGQITTLHSLPAAPEAALPVEDAFSATLHKLRRRRQPAVAASLDTAAAP